jgi:hypothetical protein
VPSDVVQQPLLVPRVDPRRDQNSKAAPRELTSSRTPVLRGPLCIYFAFTNVAEL